MIRIFLLFAVVISFPYSGFSQSKAIETFIDTHGEGKKYYVYQSVMRILNVKGDPDFNRMIRDVRRIVVHQPNVVDDSTGVKKPAIRQLIRQLEKEGFEPLIEARESNMRITFFSRGAIDQAEFVLVIRDREKAYVAEVEGTLNMEYIGALANADISELTNYLK